MANYKVKLTGGRQNGNVLDHPVKIGGYVRMTYEDGVVEEYHRVNDDASEGTYALQD